MSDNAAPTTVKELDAWLKPHNGKAYVISSSFEDWRVQGSLFIGATYVEVTRENPHLDLAIIMVYQELKTVLGLPL